MPRGATPGTLRNAAAAATDTVCASPAQGKLLTSAWCTLCKSRFHACSRSPAISLEAMSPSNQKTNKPDAKLYPADYAVSVWAAGSAGVDPGQFCGAGRQVTGKHIAEPEGSRRFERGMAAVTSQAPAAPYP
jgi:hypothetical protein